MQKILYAIAVVLALSTSGRAQSPPVSGQPPVLVVTGNGRVLAAPDETTVRLGIVRESRDAPRIVAYDASNTVSVRLQNLSLVGPVIDAGLKAGANQPGRST